MNKKTNNIEVIYPFGVHDLLTTTIAAMFANLQEYLKDGNSEIDHDLKRKLIMQFQIVFDNIQTINHKVEYSEAIEELADKASATNLDNNFKELLRLGNYQVNVTIEDMIGISLTPSDHIDIRRITRNWGIRVSNPKKEIEY